MNLIQPVLLNVELKATRGLAYDAQAYLARPELFQTMIMDVISGGIPVKPGEETRVPVALPGLQPNADFKRIQATLIVNEDPKAAPNPPTAVSFQDGNGPVRNFKVGAQAPPGLSNVTVRLDQGEVFWSSPGLLPTGSHTLPDFAGPANAYLDRATPVNGQVTLVFLVKSDAAGKVHITIDEGDYEYALLQTQTWPNELDGTLRVDRNLNLDFHRVERLELTPVDHPQGRKLSLLEVRLDAGGQFGPERLLGSVAAHDGREFGTVNTEYSLAQGFTLNGSMIQRESVHCAGITGFYRHTEEAELYVELQGDATGQAPATTETAGRRVPSVPAAGAPLAKANLSLKASEEKGASGWVFARFETPADLKVDTPYWIVIKGIRGEVQAGLQAQPMQAETLRAEQDQPARPAQVMINRGGQLWKSLGRNENLSWAALLSLVYLPEADNQTAAVEIAVEGTAAALRLDPGPTPQTLTLKLGEADLPGIALVVRSHAAGTLSVANVIQTYRLV